MSPPATVEDAAIGARRPETGTKYVVAVTSIDKDLLC
jgi:hypothetical protein